MVRVTRFSFEDGMNVNEPIPRDHFDEDELEDFAFDDEEVPKARSPQRREPKRVHPGDRRPDRRHVAGGDWAKPAPHESAGEGDVKVEPNA